MKGSASTTVIAKREFTARCIVVITLSLLCFSGVSAAEEADALEPIVRIGLVADSHYDTFPVGEKAPWQPMSGWLQEQKKRSTTVKRRYDVAKDKMLETADVFNRAKGMTFAVNLGDLVNNDLMWNLKPILDAFNTINAPHFSILGNHDLRAHNDRFGKNNATQEDWIRQKFGLGSKWYYAFDLAPFHFMFIDSMALDERGTKKCDEHLAWIQSELQRAQAARLATVVFGHIAIGMDTNQVVGPVLKSSEHIVAAFFGHEHRGGYSKQRHVHTVIINGQIETLTNAFAVLDLFADRAELTGFGRVPTRAMPFTNNATLHLIAETLGSRRQGDQPPRIPKSGDHDLSRVGYTPLPPSKLWEGEVLQQLPPLNLHLPGYRKPQLQPAEPHQTSSTVFGREYRLWPRRILTHAPEDKVDLTSYGGKEPTWLWYTPAAAAAETVGGGDERSANPGGATSAKADRATPTLKPSRRPTDDSATKRVVDDDREVPLRSALPVVVLLSFVVAGSFAAFVLRRRRTKRPGLVSPL